MLVFLCVYVERVGDTKNDTSCMDICSLFVGEAQALFLFFPLFVFAFLFLIFLSICFIGSHFSFLIH